MTLPKKGKAFVIGDIHSNAQNLLAILQQIQSNNSTNLDKNKDNKIVILGDTRSINRAAADNALKSDLDTMHGEAVQRFLMLLQARYPDQVHVLNGNHDMYIHGFINQRNNSWKLSDEDQQHNIDTWGIPGKSVQSGDGAGIGSGISNEDLNYRHIGLSPLMIRIGDAKNGETVRIFQHSPGQANQPTPDDIEKMTDQVKRHEEAMSIYAGHGGLTERALSDLNRRLGSNKIYFGHIGPPPMLRKLVGNEIEKLDRDKTNPVGELKGGGVYVDSQTHNMSGFVEIDLDNDAAPEKVHRMDDVLKKYKPDSVEADLNGMATSKLP